MGNLFVGCIGVPQPKCMDQMRCSTCELCEDSDLVQAELRSRVAAATIVQAAWRCVRQRWAFLALLEAAVVIQRAVRRWLARRASILPSHLAFLAIKAALMLLCAFIVRLSPVTALAFAAGL